MQRHRDDDIGPARISLQQEVRQQVAENPAQTLISVVFQLEQHPVDGEGVAVWHGYAINWTGVTSTEPAWRTDFSSPLFQ